MDKHRLTDELIAAFLEGNVSPAEAEAVLAAARKNARLREYLAIAGAGPDIMPMRAEAAAGKRDNRCDIRCEQYVLQRFGITVSETELAERSASANWLKEGGTPLFQMGNLCAKYGLSVARQYDATPEDVRKALAEGYEVIVAVDGGEIDGDPVRERGEDAFIGRIPDHSLVILSYGNVVVCYNPFHGETPQMIPEDRFIDAWDDSNCYMVKINTKEAVAKTYTPAPLDLSDVTLPESLTELTEAIAENTHEVWSQSRLKEGWTYGPERDDTRLKHPDLLPYSDLPDGEKEYDRATAMNAIKLIVKLGYEIVKKQALPNEH